MRWVLLASVMTALFFVEPIRAQLPTGSASLRVVPAVPSSCPGEGHFFTGQMVRITGGGFNPSAVVEIYFSVQDGSRVLLDTRSADSDGGLDEVVALPAELSTPVTAALEAQGAYSTDGLLNLSALFTLLTSGGMDSDGDLVPDVCDNCPNDMNNGQEDDDLDGVGNVCDACPMDQENDSDNDGICGDVDVCPFDPNNDADGDQICGNVDNCPSDANPSQMDVDANGIGDACQTNATCADGVDNDDDGLIDHPSDPGCSDPADTTETDPALPCDDGIDNDADALTDFVSGSGLSDPGCADGSSPAEDPECDDGVDNDGDGAVDWDGNFDEFPADPECSGLGSHTSEMPEPRLIVGLVSGILLLSMLRRFRR